MHQDRTHDRPRAAGSEPTSRLPVLVLVFALFPAALLYAERLHVPSDDTYIFLVYAKNFLAGEGLTFNGTRVEGFTSVLWTALVTLVGATGLPLPGVARGLSAASGLLALLATYRLGRALGLSDWSALLASALLAASADFAIYVAAGMETALFAACVAFSLAIALEEEPGESLRGLRLPLVLSTTALVRPDGVLVGALVVGTLTLRSRDPRAALRCVALCALCLAPVYLVKFLYYGHWLPATFHVKRTEGFSGVATGLHYLYLHGRRYAVLAAFWLGLLGYRLARRDGERLARLALPLLLLFVWIAYVIQLGGDLLMGARLLVPVLPVFAASLVVLLGEVRPVASRLAAAGLAVLVLVVHLTRPELRLERNLARVAAEARTLVASHLVEHFPPDTLVALNAAGMIPFYTGFPTVDMMGLNDPFIAHRGQRDPGLPPGHQAGDGDYVLSRNPDVIVFGSQGTRRSSRFLSDRQIQRDPTFRERYRALRIGEDPTGAAIWIHVRR